MSVVRITFPGFGGGSHKRALRPYTARAARLVLVLGWWLLAGGLVTGSADGSHG